MESAFKKQFCCPFPFRFHLGSLSSPSGYCYMTVAVQSWFFGTFYNFLLLMIAQVFVSVQNPEGDIIKVLGTAIFFYRMHFLIRCFILALYEVEVQAKVLSLFFSARTKKSPMQTKNGCFCPI